MDVSHKAWELQNLILIGKIDNNGVLDFSI